MKRWDVGFLKTEMKRLLYYWNEVISLAVKMNETGIQGGLDPLEPVNPNIWLEVPHTYFLNK